MFHIAENVIRERGSLVRFKHALRSGRVVMGFIGGSITEAQREGNWPYFIAAWFIRRYPDVEFVWENAAIGGTGSLSGIMRADRDLIAHHCDIVFMEYAVNEPGGEETFRTREGLVRKLLQSGCDVAMVYVYCQAMYQDMMADRIPESIADLERIAEYYRIPAIWSGRHALNELMAGRMSWETWLPEGLHPEAFGSGIYAEPVIAYLEKELNSPNRTVMPKGDALPEPMNADNWSAIYDIPWDDITFQGPWMEMREVMIPWYRTSHTTSAVGAKLSFPFEGRALCAMFNYGKTMGKFIYRFDGGEEKEYLGERLCWVPDKNYCRPILFGDDLGPGRHTFELTVVHGNEAECKGSNCRIYSFMAVK